VISRVRHSVNKKADERGQGTAPRVGSVNKEGNVVGRTRVYQRGHPRSVAAMFKKDAKQAIHPEKKNSNRSDSTNPQWNRGHNRYKKGIKLRGTLHGG